MLAGRGPQSYWGEAGQSGAMSRYLVTRVTAPQLGGPAEDAGTQVTRKWGDTWPQGGKLNNVMITQLMIIPLEYTVTRFL